MDMKALAGELVGIVKTYTASAVKSLSERLDGIDQKIAAIPHGPKGDDGRDGEDGKSLTIADIQPALDVAIANHLLDFEKRLQGAFSRAVEAIQKPQDGKDGNDGLGFDDLSIEQKSPRLVCLKFMRGDQVKEFEVRIPAMIYRGVFKEGEAYEQGDTVTWSGSLWHAKELTRDKPGTEAWQLAAKRGQDGKNFGVKL